MSFLLDRWYVAAWPDEVTQQPLARTFWIPAQAFDRSIDNQVSRLRRKLERDPARPELLKTVWGGGYVFATDVREVR